MANPAPRRTGKTARRPPIDEIAEERARDARVVAHVRVGKSFDDIAELEGFADRSGAWRAFWRVVNRNEAREVDQLRAWQGEIIDAALAVWVPKMLDGDRDASVQALRWLERHAKLWGLDAPARMIANIAQDIPDDPAERQAAILSLVEKIEAHAAERT